MSGDLLVLAPLRLEARAVASGAPCARVVRTGAGPARARATAARLREEPPGRTDAVVVAGVAAGLDGRLRPGHLVVAERVIDAAGRTVAALSGAEQLAQRLRSAGLPASVGAVAGVASLVRGRQARAHLASLGAAAADMESAQLLAHPSPLPTAVVRAVVDTPTRELLSLRTLPGGVAALRALRAAAPVLVEWAAAAGREQPVPSGALLAEPLPPEVR